MSNDFCKFIDDVNPDVVHFHHFLGFGLEAIRAVRRVRPNVPIVATLHEYLSICNNHGQMVKAKTGQLPARFAGRVRGLLSGYRRKRAA